MTVLKQTQPVAKKTHICDWCFATVKIGEKYHRRTSVTEWGLADWVSCKPCEELLAAVWDWATYNEDGVGPENYQEFCQEHRDDPVHGEAATAYLARRTRVDPWQGVTRLQEVDPA